MKLKKIIYLSLICSFLFAQSIFLHRHLDHFEDKGHFEFCTICVLDSSSLLGLSQDIIPLQVFETYLSFKNNSLIVVKKNFHSQSLPRSPPCNSFLFLV